MKHLMASQGRVLTPVILLGTIISATFALTASADLTNCAPVPPGLVSWWAGEGSAADSYGTNNGTLQGGMSFAPGKVGQAFSFNGTNANVVVAASSSLNVGVGSGLTIEAWIKPADVSVAQPLVEWNGGFFDAHFWISFQNTGGLYANLVDTSRNYHAFASGGGLLTQGSYQHVALTYDKSSGVGTFFVNGGVVTQQNLGSFTPETEHALYLGLRPSGGTITRFAGQMDEVSVYGRALSTAEVQAIYAAGSAGKCPPGAAPSITTQPTSQTVLAGATAAFTATATGSPPLNYQWHFNGTNVAGATGTALTLSNVQFVQAGSYSVRVTNAFGSVISSNALLTVTLPPPCATPPSGLVGWWRGEGAASDFAGTNNGVLEGGVAFATGEVGQAFKFNGTNADARVPASASLNVGLADGFTIEAWINPADITQGHEIVEWNNGTFGVTFLVADPAGAGPGSLYISVKDTSYNDHIFSTPGGLLFSNIWQHVAATYVRSNGNTVLYINGVARAQANLGVFTPRTIGDLYIGVRPSEGVSGRFVGLMDEVSLYNRTLSASEIQAIYSASSAGKCLTGTPPFISVQPVGQTVTVGSTATFAVVAGGTPPLSYQWRFSGTNIAGATGTSLILTNVQSAQAGNYVVVVTNLAGSVTSSNAALVVNSSTACAPAPQGLVSWWRGEGAATDFAGTNNGVLEGGMAFATGEVGQAFKFNGTNADVRVPAAASLNVGLADGFTVEAWINPADITQGHEIVEWNNGTFGVTFLVADPAGAGPGSLFISVKDTSYNDHIFSTPGGLLFSNIWQHVAATYVRSNGNTVLYINGGARAQANLGVFTPRTIGDLYIGVRPSEGVSGRFPGLMDEVSLYNRTLSAAEIQAIYNAGSAGKCPLGVAPSIVTQPTSQAVLAGATAAFSVTAAGTPSLSYQWRLNGTNVVGATGTSLTLANVQASSAGSYSVRVTNAFGSVISSNAVLTVNPPSSCTPPRSGLVSWWRGEGTASDFAGNNNGVLEGGVAFAAGEVGQAFKFNGTNADVRIPASGSLNVGAGDGLTIETWVDPADVSTERPLVEWNSGIFGSHFWIAVASQGKGGPGSLYANIKDIDLQDHSVFSSAGVISANKYQHVAVTYSKSTGVAVLYANGVVLTSSNLGVFTPMTTGDLYFGLRPFDAGAGTRFTGQMDDITLYSRALTATEIQAIYNAGSAGKCLGLAPSIVMQPASLAVNVGATAAFSVTAAGTAPLSYQWQFSGSNIAGATGTSLTLSNVQSTQAGNYAVRVSNTFGSTISSNALLTVTSPPPCATPPLGLVSWWRAESNALDSIDSNSGVLHNGVGFAGGEVGQAFVFNGTNSYVEVPDAPALRLTNQLTIEFWVKRRDLQNEDYIINKGGDYTRRMLNYGVTITQPQWGGTLAFTFAGGARHSLSITDLNWHHCAVTARNGDVDPSFYVDGVQRPVTLRQGASTINLYASTAALDIGAQVDPASGWFFYSGAVVDELSIYSRALTAVEIQTIYTAGSAGKCPGVAPTIITPPASLAVLAGSTAAFSVTAAGTPPLSYQWRFNGTNIAGATGASFALSNVQLAQAGSYSVRVTNAFGSIISSNALLTVTLPPPCAPPPSGLVSWWKAEGNALDQVGGNNGVLLNGVGFDAGVVGQAFRFNGSSNSYVEVADSPALRLTNALTIECWAKRLNASEVHVLVEKGGDWTGGQSNFELALNDTYSGGKHFGFSFAGGWRGCAVTPDTAWHHYAAIAVNGQADPILYIDGVSQTVTYRGGAGTMNLFASTRPLHIGAQVDTRTGWLYYSSTMIDEPSVFNRALSASEIQAIYNAGGAGKCPPGVAPSIITPPASQTVVAGTSATFTVAAAGTLPLGYQWQFSGTNIASATGTSLTLSNAQSAQAGNYAVRVTNAFGSVISSNALLTVNPLQSCAPPPSGLVSWWPGERNANDAVGGNNGTLQGGVTFSPGVVGQAFNFNPTNGTVVVPDSSSLRITNQLTIEAWINARSVSGQPGLISKVGIATGDHGYQLGLWDNRLVGLMNGPGQVWPAEVVASGPLVTTGQWYHVVFTYDQSAMKLYVNGMPAATNVIGPQVIAATTTDLQISGADGHGYFDGLIDEPSVYNRALSATEIAAIYTAGSAGKCQQAPAIITQPVSLTVLAGAPASFTATAAGTPPLSYQWRLNGTNIVGATGTSLTLSNVQSAQAGSYSLRVTNALGSIISSNALLTVILTPPCAPPPSGLVSWWRAEGDASDFVGINSGILQGGVSFAPGRVGQAFGLNGTNSYIQVASSSVLKPTGPFTVEAWINYDTLLGANGGTIVAKGQDAESAMDWSLVIGPTHKLRPLLNVAGNWLAFNCVSTLATGVWYHVAMVYDGASLRGYVNGSLDGTLAASGAVQATDFPFRIGAYAPVNGTASKAYFPGRIDELAFYNRALLPAEIQAIYDAGSAGKCPPGVAPLIITHPASQTVVAGSSATFTVTAGGTPPLSYQWRFGGTNIAGATGPSLSLSNVQSAQAGNYSVRVTNAFGAINSSNALLTVTLPPPCAPPSSNLVSWWAAEGNANDNLGANNGAFHGGVSFVAGEVHQAFSFDGSSGYVNMPASASLNVGAGGGLTFECWIKPAALAAAQPVAEWNSGAHTGVHLWISQPPPYGSGSGSIYVNLIDTTGAFHTLTSGSGIVTTNGFQHVALTYDKASGIVGLYYNGGLMATQALGSFVPQTTYGFYLGNRVSEVPFTLFHGLMDEASLYSRALSGAEIQAIYTAGSAGKCPLGVAPSIITQPVSQAVLAGATAAFSVTAAGTPPLGYQWRLNGTNVAGGTGTSLILNNVQPAQAGNYSVRVTNAFGSVVSSNALLTVNRLPVALCADVVVSADANCVANASVNHGSFDPDGDPISISQVPPGPYPLGTNRVTLIVTDGKGTSNSCSALVIVRDTTPPVLACPGGKVLEFQDEKGTVATYSVTAADTCSAVTLVATPPSGSVFPIGVTPVQVQATDGGSNSAQCSFTVTVLGAQGVKSNVLAQLVALRASVVLTEAFAQVFDDAILNLGNSLNPAYWIDQTHLQPRVGNTAMIEEKLTAGELKGIMEARKCPVDPAVLQGFIDRIVKSDRLLAVISIQDATKAGLSARKVAEALAMVAAGDRAAAGGYYANAIEDYRLAWRHVLVLRLEVSLNPDGTTRVQFIGNNSQSYRVEMSTDMVKWATLGTCTADAEGNVEFSDPNVAKQPLRFYRAVEQ